MTLDEAFILTCHTGYMADKTFIKDKGASQDFLDRCAQLLERDVYLEEFVVESEKVIKELKEKSYDTWMEIVNKDKE